MRTCIRAFVISVLILNDSFVSAQYDLTFTLDTGVRMIDGEIPEIGHDTANNIYYLFYTLNPGGNMVATSSDGITFGAGGLVGSDFSFFPLRTLLPNGQWRNYLYNQALQQMESAISNDGITFVNEPGIRYVPVDNDNNSLGVYDVYTMPDNSLTMLYIGDLPGLNNTRKAVSTDSGVTFIRIETNVFADSGVVLPNPGASYVDVTSIPLGGSTRRLICMRGGYGIYSFTSNDYGDNYTYDNLLFTRDQASSVFGVTILGMYDPAMVLLDDGRYRIYFCANYFVDTVLTYGIFSATSAYPGSLVENELNADGIILYPNPATDRIYLETTENKAVNITIFDLGGHLVLDCRNKINTWLDISTLKTGLYIAEIWKEGTNKRFRKKFIK